MSQVAIYVVGSIATGWLSTLLDPVSGSAVVGVWLIVLVRQGVMSETFRRHFWGQGAVMPPAAVYIVCAVAAVIAAVVLVRLSQIKGAPVDPSNVEPVPRITLADTLEVDKEHRRLRLTVETQGRGAVTPTATIQWIQSSDGQRHPNTPIPLEWMHHQDRISRGGTGKVDVVAFNDEHPNTVFFGRNDRPGRDGYWRFVTIWAGDGAAQPVRFCVRVETEREFQDRCFLLEPDRTYPLGVKVVRIPVPTTETR